MFVICLKDDDEWFYEQIFQVVSLITPLPSSIQFWPSQ
jgi:hypothetical protein